MGWKDAPVITTEPAWKKAPTTEPEKRSAEDEKLAADVSTLLGPDENKRVRVAARTEGRKAGVAGTGGLAVQQGVLRNFADEIGAAGAASGLPVGTPPIISAPIGAARMLFGDEDAKRTYAREAERLRGYYEGASEANPVTALAGEVVGGGAGPVKIPGAAAPTSLVGRVGHAAVTSAADAALAGAGAGEDAAGRTTGAATGGAVGGTLGAVLPAFGKAASTIYRRFAPTAGNIEEQAAGRVGRALEESLPTPADRARVAQELGEAYQRGQPVTLGDVGGASLEREARAASNVSPEAERTLRSVYEPRFQDQAERTSSWWDRMTGGADTLETRDALRNAARRENKPLYDAAYAKGQAVWDDDLATLTNSAEMRKAIRDAAATGSDYAAAAGERQVPRNPFQEGPDGTLSLPEGQAPTLQFWDHVQRNLRRAAERAPPGGDEARTINQLRDALNAKLDATVPEFGEARRVARGYFGAEDALDAGRGFLDLPVRGGAHEERRAFAQMKPAEKELFRTGITEAIRDRMRAVTDNQEIGRLFNSPEMRSRLNLALGPERASQLEQVLKVERTMSSMKNALGNSTTAKQLIDAGWGGAGGAGAGWFTGEGDYTSPTSLGMAGFLAGGLKGHVDVKVANRIAQMLVSQNPNELRRGTEILRSNTKLREAFDAVSTRLASVLGQQTGASEARP